MEGVQELRLNFSAMHTSLGRLCGENISEAELLREIVRLEGENAKTGRAIIALYAEASAFHNSVLRQLYEKGL